MSTPADQSLPPAPGEQRSDPANYHRLSEPFTGAAEANAALNAFLADVWAARQTHRIADVGIVVSLPCDYDGAAGQALVHSHYGDQQRAEELMAYGLGTARAEQRERINKILAGELPRKSPGRRPQ